MTDPGAVMWAEACALVERAERLHRQFFQPTPRAAWAPPDDVFESDREVLIVAALPGIARDDLEVFLDGNQLVLQGTRRLPILGTTAVITRLEVPYGRFERRIVISGSPLRLQRLELENGCLSLRITK